MRCINNSLTNYQQEGLSHGAFQAFLNNGSNGPGNGSFVSLGGSATNSSFSSGHTTHFYIEQALYTVAIPAICCLGILGNVLNLVVLTRKSLQTTMDRMEKSSHCGLIALAVSELCLCLCLLPLAFVHVDQFADEFLGLPIVYRTYYNAIINTFVTTSTWLTVAMAFSRYLGICHPLKARQVVGMKFAKLIIISVFILSILFNFPRFWTYEIMCAIDTRINETKVTYFLGHGWLKQSRSRYKTYMSTYFVFSIIGPMLILVFCNSFLIKALRQSAKMRKQCCRSTRSYNRASGSANSVTLMLAVIVAFNIILVTPAEIFHFFDDVVIDNSHMTDLYNVVVAGANTLQAINFSFNFLLYCATNASFRHTAKCIISCQGLDKKSYVFTQSRNHDSLTGVTIFKTSMRSFHGRNSTTFTKQRGSSQTTTRI